VSPAQAVSYERRLYPMKLLGQSGLVRRSPQGGDGRAAYGKTVWSWPSSLRSSTCGGGTGVNRRGAGEFREATVTTRIRRRGEHGI